MPNACRSWCTPMPRRWLMSSAACGLNSGAAAAVWPVAGGMPDEAVPLTAAQILALAWIPPGREWSVPPADLARGCWELANARPRLARVYLDGIRPAFRLNTAGVDAKRNLRIE